MKIIRQNLYEVTGHDFQLHFQLGRVKVILVEVCDEGQFFTKIFIIGTLYKKILQFAVQFVTRLIKSCLYGRSDKIQSFKVDRSVK